jgi:uncharacterized membrane protein
MAIRIKWLGLLLSSFIGIISFDGHSVIAASDLTLYTPYTKISVPPGQSIDYVIDVINNSTEIKNAELSLTGLPRGWNYDMKAGGFNIRQLSVMPGEKKNINLRIEVPLKVNKGSYRFQVVAGGFDALPITVIVSEQGTFKTEFTSDQANMEGIASSLFTFQASLKNSTGDNQLYALMANAPPGWNVAFKVNYKQVTSVEINANSKTDVVIEIDPPDMIQAGKYNIPVRAATNATSATLELEVVVTGSYAIGVTTPTGLLSAGITAGDEKRLELVVLNSGSAELKSISLTSAAPINWEVTFDPDKVDKLEPGKSVRVFATVKADKKAIAGDYVTNIEAKTAEVSSKASFRISVKTPMLYGWIGILIIIAALGSVYYLFRKYGRR